jgi:hypothetical protein
MEETISRSRLWTGRIATGACVLFLFVDALGKLTRVTPVVEGTVRLGYSEATVVPLGIVLASCTMLYLAPRTELIGAILLTGYLGGAVATHVRIGDPLFAVVFPFVIGSLVWGGLWLRNTRLQSLLPIIV